MKTFLKWSLVLLVLCGLGYGISIPLGKYLEQRNRVNWRTEKVARGNIKSVVNSTGTVKPKQQVAIGSFVSGPIREKRDKVAAERGLWE